MNSFVAQADASRLRQSSLALLCWFTC